MKPFQTLAHIHSLDGAMDEITVLEEVGKNYRLNLLPSCLHSRLFLFYVRNNFSGLRLFRP